MTSVVRIIEDLFKFHEIRVEELRKKKKGASYSEHLISSSEVYLLDNGFNDFDFSYFDNLARKELSFSDRSH